MSFIIIIIIIIIILKTQGHPTMISPLNALKTHLRLSRVLSI